MPTQMNYNAAGAKRKSRVWARRIVFAFFVFVGLVVLLESPLTRIRQISVAGNQTIPAAKIIQDAGLRTGMSLWQVNRGAIKQQVVSRQPLVQKVNVQTNLMTGTVELKIQQKSIVGLLSFEHVYYELLNDGTIYAQTSQGAAASLPIVQVTGLKRVTLGGVPSVMGLAVLCGQLSRLKSSDLAGVSQIVLNSYGDATVYFTNGFAAQATSTRFSVVMSQIQAVIQYFVGQGYGPGLIDMSGQPPYRYTPFQQPKQGGN